MYLFLFVFVVLQSVPLWRHKKIGFGFADFSGNILWNPVDRENNYKTSMLKQYLRSYAEDRQEVRAIRFSAEFNKIELFRLERLTVNTNIRYAL